MASIARTKQERRDPRKPVRYCSYNAYSVPNSEQLPPQRLVQAKLPAVERRPAELKKQEATQVSQ